MKDTSIASRSIPVPKRIRWTYILAVISVLLIAVILRLYRIDERTIFSGDEGMDLIIVWNMEHEGHRPLVGPFLSVRHIYAPPTYYYISWLFYRLDPTPHGVIFGYFLISVVSLVFLMKLSRDISGKRASVILGVLVALSWPMIAHGRQYWQPFPMQLFLAAWLYSLWHAYGKKSGILLFLSGILFALAVSVYPSAVILAPLAGYQLFRWYRRIARTSIPISILFAAVTGIATALPVFMPQIIFEIMNSFPTLGALASYSEISVIHSNPVQSSVRYAHLLVDNLVNVKPWLPQLLRQYIKVLYLAGCVALFYTIRANRRPPDPRYHSAFSFFSPAWILLGLVFIAFTPDIEGWRLWALLPLQFILLSTLFAEGLRAGRPAKILTVLLFLVYCVSNVVTTWKYLHPLAENDIADTRHAATIIKADMRERNVNSDNMTVIYKEPNPHTYNIYRILYWLVTDRVLRIPLHPDGNKPAFPTSNPPLKDTVYLICSFPDIQTKPADCVNQFLRENDTYRLRKTDPGRFSIFVLENPQERSPTPGVGT